MRLLLHYNYTMQVTLTPRAEEALRQQLAHSPGRQPEEVIEEALTEMGRRTGAPRGTGAVAAPESFRPWLRELREGSRPAPHLAAETFTREMIYRDHD